MGQTEESFPNSEASSLHKSEQPSAKTEKVLSTSKHPSLQQREEKPASGEEAAQ